MIRVIVVEDFDLLREDLCEQIDGNGDMTVVGEASDGLEAVRAASEAESDIILMDIEMETVSAGIQAAERIRDLNLKTQVIFLTAHETENTIIMAMGTGAVDYIVKGSREEDIIRHIRSAYSGKPLMDVKIQETIMREYTRLRRSEKSLIFFINNVSQLTAAERELVRLLLEGRKVREIAAVRCVEIITVKTQIKSLLRKFGCSRTKEIVTMIRDLNLNHLF